MSCFPSSAMQQVLENLKELPSGTGAKDIDLIFLRGIMESPIVRSLAKVMQTFNPTITVYSCSGARNVVNLSTSYS